MGAPQFIFVLHLARCSGMRVWPCGSVWWRIYISANLERSGAGVTRCHSCLLAHARSRRVARGVEGSTDPEQHPIGRLAVSLLGSPRISFSFCIWLAVAGCVCGRSVQRVDAFTFVQIWTVPGAGLTRCHSRLLAHARSRRVARGVQGSTDPEQHPIGRLAVSLLGSARISCIVLH